MTRLLAGRKATCDRFAGPLKTGAVTGQNPGSDGAAHRGNSAQPRPDNEMGWLRERSRL